jgi:hypothetical protein
LNDLFVVYNEQRDTITQGLLNCALIVKFNSGRPWTRGHHTTCLHVPSIGPVVAGDAAQWRPRRSVSGQARRVLWRSVPSKAAPVIDTGNGGSGVRFPETLAKAATEVSGILRDITRQEYADFNRDSLATVQVASKAGKTADQAAATLELPNRYTGYDMTRAKTNVEAIYKELNAK